MNRSPHATRPARQPSRRCFTLVELMISMAILVVMLLIVMQILIFSQRIWSTNNSQTQIYENARAALEVIERDVRTIVTSSLPNRQISLYIGDPDVTDASKSLHVCMVSCADPPIESDSRLVEISYRFHTDRSSTTLKPFTLYRQVVSDRDPVNWDFNNRPTDWYLNNKVSANLPDPEKVIGGVADFHMDFYDSTETKIPPDTETLDMPLRIEIYLLVFDEKLVNQPEHVRFRTARSFAKFIQPAGHQQGN